MQTNDRWSRSNARGLSGSSVAMGAESREDLASSIMRGYDQPRWRRLLWSTDRRRLVAYIVAYEGQLIQLTPGGVGTKHGDWVHAALQLLERAFVAVKHGDVNTGWSCYNSAKRLEVLGFDEVQRRALARALQFEAAEKIGSWRGRAIAALVSEQDDPVAFAQDSLKVINPTIDAHPQGEPLTRSDTRLVRRYLALALQLVGVDKRRIETIESVLFESVEDKIAPSEPIIRLAMELRDESLQNHYWKFHHLRRQLRILSGVLLATVAILIPLAVANASLLWASPTSRPGRLWLLAGLFGILGGCLSAFQSYTSKSLQVRVPELFANAIITILRPLIGGAAALVAFTFLASGAINLSSNTGAALLTVAFVAGFSERIILRTVESIGGKDE